MQSYRWDANEHPYNNTEYLMSAKIKKQVSTTPTVS